MSALHTLPSGSADAGRTRPARSRVALVCGQSAGKVPTLRIFALILSSLALALPASAGQDFQLWSEAGIRVKVAKRLRLEFDGHLRLEKNLSAVDSVMPELALSYRAAKFLRLEAGFRYIAEPVESLEDTYLESWYRFFAGARLSHRMRPVTLKYRLRFEEEFGWPWKKNEALAAKHTVRNLLGVEVRLPGGFIPNLSGELFLRIADPDGPLHKWRATAGVDWEIGRHTLSLYYRLEDPLGDAEDPTRHILGTGYHYSF